MTYLQKGKPVKAGGCDSCGPQCGCRNCRASLPTGGMAGFGERYEREEDEEPTPLRGQHRRHVRLQPHRSPVGDSHTQRRLAEEVSRAVAPLRPCGNCRKKYSGYGDNCRRCRPGDFRLVFAVLPCRHPLTARLPRRHRNIQRLTRRRRIHRSTSPRHPKQVPRTRRHPKEEPPAGLEIRRHRRTSCACADFALPGYSRHGSRHYSPPQKRTASR